jgi:gamma-glutamyl hydrolase
MRTLLLLVLIMTINTAMPPQTPIIGIFTLPSEIDDTKEGLPRLSNNQTYIAASYIKFIEMSGAQVVPIFSFNDTAYLDNMLSKVNGVLFTGGYMDFDIKHRWTANADHILKYAIESNNRGNPFPIWGTCLGFELLAYLTSGYDPKVLFNISS